MNKCYLFNNQGEYFGEYFLQIDPLETKLKGETVYVGLPQNATFIAPPKVLEDEIAVFNGKEWIKVKKEIANKNENIKEMTLEELKELKIKEIKDATGKWIRETNNYPDYKQFNISNFLINTETSEQYTQADKDKMINIINSGIIQCANFQKEVKNIQIIEELNNYKYNFKMGE